ncbi:hypothetical protein LMG7974_00020 [Campylobacter majalis]|uniref:histidine kinase n=1 Tax=Campylobacter majalis TaxID=2790656 RepID=A0ABM8Q1F4_9BACT|nr:ArsS family sensor histidine kinase [Campylobacter majalis]CAD7286660.1 hypothetical protein LMG7974_00020 [Campylobacter majalis]
MKRSSIFITITIIFLIALASIFVVFLWLMEFDKQNYTRELNSKYSNVAQANLFYMSGLMDFDKYNDAMKNVEMSEISDESDKYSILQNAHIIEEIKDDIGSIAILLYEKRHYLKIQHLDNIKILRDKEYQPYRYEMIKAVFAVIVVVILIAYIFVIYKLKPLRKLKRQIVKFANGDLENIQNVSSGKDEISEVAEAFYNATNEIKILNNSRQLFLRNIMHELKTPITKGRLVVEMMDDSKHKDRFVSIFNKLESLINELVAVEQTTSKIKLTNKTTCFMADVIDEAIDIAMIDKEQVMIDKTENLKLDIDFKLFSIAVKNMIDNAIKYSPDKRVKIEILTDKINFISKGLPLKNELNFYIQPFIKGENSQKSFGLGLYIVSNILNSHRLKMGYTHQNGYNIFYFENLKAIIKT